ncbi:MAG: hypothetical protein HYX75_09280 [Acidobacteria bacterium]|nr:hypothetical protein [Acidobacteriota bacterium]
MIDIDSSVLIIIFIIVALVFILERLFFNPVIAAIDERNRRVEGPKLEAARILSDHDKQLAGLQSAIAQARREGNSFKARVRGEAQKEGDGVVEKSQREVRELLDRQAADLEHQKARARAELATGIQAIAQRISGYFVRG